jgi:hypothetical protein
MSKRVPSKDIEIFPDAWDRFERAMAVVVKSPPQHRAKAKAKSAKSPSALLPKPGRRKKTVK